MMREHRWPAMPAFLIVGLLFAPLPALAQSTVDEEREQEKQLKLAEPDFSLINLPTTLRLPLHRAAFRVTHRFNRDLRRGTLGEIASDLFGLDNGAVIGLEVRFAPLRHVDAGLYRSSLGKTVQFYAKYDGWHQSGVLPVSVSGLVSVEGADNFRQRRQPALGAVVSRTMGDRLAVYASPVWVHNTGSELGLDRDTFFVGLGGRVRIVSHFYAVAETSPRLAGLRSGSTAYAVGVEKLVGGHMFQLNFSNSSGTTLGRLAGGGVPGNLYLGFNITRKFWS